MSRKDGSIASELKFNPRPKSPHGGWGSLRRNNETLSHQVMAAILLKSQGYNIEEINVSDSMDGKWLALPIERGYKLYWENEKGELKFWACVLGSHTYKKHVLPNFSDVPTEGNE